MLLLFIKFYSWQVVVLFRLAVFDLVACRWSAMHLDIVLFIYFFVLGLLFTGLSDLRDLSILLILENVFPSL